MITDNYIKMCSKADEIQKWWFPNICDLSYDKSEKEIKPITLIAEKIWLSERERGCNFIWLPTQEQLQEMLEEIKNNTYIAFRFNHFLNVEYNNDTFQPAYIVLNSINPVFMCSMNEFWLAFVMKERWNKVWDGENWVKEVRE